MMRHDQLRQGGSTDDEPTMTTMDDPFSGNTGGGKTGSEVLAEGGAPEAAATIDPDASSVKEKMKQDGVSSTVTTITELAQDGNDSNSEPTFDNVNDTTQGRSDLRDSAKALAETATNAATDTANQQAETTEIPTAETAARNAANQTGGSTMTQGGGFLAGLFRFIQSLLASLFGGA